MMHDDGDDEPPPWIPRDHQPSQPILIPYLQKSHDRNRAK